MLTFTSLLLLLAVPQPEPIAAPKPAEPDITGYYHCVGKMPTGESYSGIVQVRRANGALLVSWRFGTETDGVGLFDGRELVVGSGNGKAALVCRYRVELDKAGMPRLAGRWVMAPGSGEPCEEHWTWLRGLE